MEKHTSHLEIERQLYKAESEVARLRALIQRARFMIAGIPGKSNHELQLLKELDEERPC